MGTYYWLAVGAALALLVAGGVGLLLDGIRESEREFDERREYP